jgi:hypothetical protein
MADGARHRCIGGIDLDLAGAALGYDLILTAAASPP